MTKFKEGVHTPSFKRSYLRYSQKWCRLDRVCRELFIIAERVRACGAGDLTRAERRELRAGFHSYPTPELIAFLWSDGLKRVTSGVLWVVMQVIFRPYP